MSGFTSRPLGQVLGQSGVAVAAPNDTNKNALATVTVPPMGPNDVLVVEADWNLTSSANNKTPAIELGGTVIAGGTAITTQGHITMKNRVHNRGATNSQVFSSTGLATYYGQSGAALGTASVDTSAGTSVIFYMTKANAGEAVSLGAYQVILYRG